MMMLITSCKFSSEDPAVRRANIDDAKANMDLASDMNIDKIRVYGGRIDPEIDRADAHVWIVESLREVVEYGQSVEVYAAMETHDDFVDTDIVRSILDAVDHPYMKIQWDTHHPFRVFKQDPQRCWDNLGVHVVDTHFKDSFLTTEVKSGYKYCLLGEGDIPIVPTLQVLKDGGYDGYLTLEWEKAWQDYLPEPTVGFPQYVTKIRERAAELSTKLEGSV